MNGKGWEVTTALENAGFVISAEIVSFRRKSQRVCNAPTMTEYNHPLT